MHQKPITAAGRECDGWNNGRCALHGMAAYYLSVRRERERGEEKQLCDHARSSMTVTTPMTNTNLQQALPTASDVHVMERSRFHPKHKENSAKQERKEQRETHWVVTCE